MCITFASLLLVLLLVYYFTRTLTDAVYLQVLLYDSLVTLYSVFYELVNNKDIKIKQV